MHVDFPDLLGNTPLHYAAKYGHPDLCKVLIDRGSFAGVKNNQGQTAYDVCSGPSVGQYLQPQHFASNMQNMGGNTTGDIYCQTQGHVMGNSNYSMPMQPTPPPYSAEQPSAYMKPAEYPSLFSQDQQPQAYPTPVQISQQAPMVQGLVINQSNSISTPASPLISGNNQMKNVHANMFGRNDVQLQKTVVSTQDQSSGQSSNIGPPSFNTPPVRPLSAGSSNYLAISPHHPSPMKAPQATPQQLLPQAQHQQQQQQLPIPQITHPSPHKQIQVIPPPQQIHQVPPQQIHQVPPQQIHQVPPQQIHQVPPQQIHQVPPQQIHQVPPQQIHQVPPQQIHQVPPQQIHQVPPQQIHQVPPQQIHQVPPQQIHNQLPNNFNSGYYPGSSPPVSQILPPPIVPQNPSYKPIAVNGSLSRIIQPGQLCI